VRQRPGSTAGIVPADTPELMIHDAYADEPSRAFALSRLTYTTVGASPLGVFRDVERPVYDELMAEQIERALTEQGVGDLDQLLQAGETWTSSRAAAGGWGIPT
jgi:2-oxoglutarate ferredoxin oxidoreductase subunit beta